MKTPQQKLLECVENLSNATRGAHGVSNSEQIALASYANEMRQEGRLSCALVILRALTEISPGSGYFQTCLGATALEDGQLDMADEALTRALELDAGCLASRVHLGEVRLGQGRRQEAIDQLRQAVVLDPGARDRFANRARMLLERNEDGNVAAQAGGTY